MNTLIIDAGPLVALLNRREAHHAWIVERLQACVDPVQTCEAALSEACLLIRRSGHPAGAVMELVERGVIVTPFHVEPEAGAIRHLMTRYAKVPMSLADACLVRMTELQQQVTVVTFDRDFRIYRRNGRHMIPLLMPPDS